MRQLSVCRRVLLAVFLVAATEVGWAADPQATTRGATGVELASLLQKIRAGHAALHSGEFLAAEVIEQETVEGTQTRVVNELRGVFDGVPGRTRRRHEFRRTRKSRGPLDRCLVVETDKATALWTNSGPIYLLPDRHALLWAEQCPIDPLALGFVGPISSGVSTDGPEMWPSFAEYEKFLAAHQAKGHVSVPREPPGYILSIEFPVLTAHGEPLQPEHAQEGAVLKIVRRIAIDSSLGFVPTKSATSFLDKRGKEVGRPWTIDVSWEMRGDVAVPVAVHTYLEHKNVDEERRTITFTWKSVNQPIAADEFDYKKFPAPADTEILDRRQLPGRVIGVIGQ
jgi:hypothetical protein